MTKDEALKLALEALDNDSDSDAAWHQRLDAKIAIRARLEQPEQTNTRYLKTEVQRLSALVRAQQITIDKLEQALAAPVQKRPQNCGTGYCSCVECVMEPEQKPVGEAHQMSELVEGFTHCIWDARVIPVGTKLYTSPPQRTWVGLTDEEIKAVIAQVSQIPPIDYTTTTYAKAIEAKLKEKNT